jgi:hypothetical protein
LARFHLRQNGSLHALHSQGNGHPKTCAPTQTDNSTAHALLTNKIMPKALKAMDMRFYWLHCREAQDQYHFLLETWNPRFGRLLDHTLSSQPPQSFLATNPNVLNKKAGNRSISILSQKFPSSHDFEEHGNKNPLSRKS